MATHTPNWYQHPQAACLGYDTPIGILADEYSYVDIANWKSNYNGYDVVIHGSPLSFKRPLQCRYVFNPTQKLSEYKYLNWNGNTYNTDCIVGARIGLQSESIITTFANLNNQKYNAWLVLNAYPIAEHIKNEIYEMPYYLYVQPKTFNLIETDGHVIGSVKATSSGDTSIKLDYAKTTWTNIIEKTGAFIIDGTQGTYTGSYSSDLGDQYITLKTNYENTLNRCLSITMNVMTEIPNNTSLTLFTVDDMETDSWKDDTYISQNTISKSSTEISVTFKTTPKSYKEAIQLNNSLPSFGIGFRYIKSDGDKVYGAYKIQAGIIYNSAMQNIGARLYGATFLYEGKTSGGESTDAGYTGLVNKTILQFNISNISLDTL